ncbi:hypothetical protein [Lentilactobacillus hilgardii]|uniref:hypothetical protein n=1 Tax=Lentilactobacillus hilgardii TaxID=1588 RepID=UPI0021C471BC|nr:hypothetical protein [Lentilactobacillus hilgardii]MCP9333761.1 hypothetical protein [Lentilactobacillus hilgardii]MCP9350347.1 hypothetical protein [Lentilactobacillus hilgardii]MCP9353241.1 hypothetical protein [Lentilactobacillus hilgardii]
MKGSKILLASVIGLLFGIATFFALSASETSQAQSVYQRIPVSYHGTWRQSRQRYPNGSWHKGSGAKLVVGSRFVKSEAGHFSGHSMGVYKTKGSVTVFPINNGHRAGETFRMKPTTYKGHKALIITYDVAKQVYVK